MISISLNFDQIDQSKLFKGKKGLYLDLIMIESPKSQYNDYIVKQSLSKEERDAGVESPIIGNAKNIVKRDPTNHNNPPDAIIDNTWPE